jgi:hypothetical protein
LRSLLGDILLSYFRLGHILQGHFLLGRAGIADSRVDPRAA